MTNLWNQFEGICSVPHPSGHLDAMREHIIGVAKENGLTPEVDEAGNVTFIVYGYMNRGMHEGRTGVTLYYYDAVVNTVEEQLFIPYNKSFDILKADIEQLSYISKETIRNAQTFPQDYDFMTDSVDNVKYICGMSVPPNMMANIATEIWNQWLGKGYTKEREVEENGT